MAGNNVIIDVRNVSKVYEGGKVEALKSASFSIRDGEFVSVIGTSGSGKSTLLNILGLLDMSNSGEVVYNGTQLSAIKDHDRFRSHTVGFVFQLHNLLPTRTALENVEIPMVEGSLSRSDRRKRAKELLEAVGLGERLDFIPSRLSGGQGQRVAIARALANNPKVVLADEPTGSLDRESTDEIMDLLKKINREHKTTMIVITHNPAISAWLTV